MRTQLKCGAVLAGALVLVGFAQPAMAASLLGEVKRSDSVIVFRTNSEGCYAINLDNVRAKTPEQWTPANEILDSAFGSIRPLTAEEIALCNDTTVPQKIWRVHDNGHTTRPAYTFSAGVLVKDPVRRATIGEPCGDFAVNVAGKTKLQYRYLISNPDLVAICEFK